MSRNLSVFDLDRTLVSETSSYAFCFHLYHRRILSLADLLFALFCKGRMMFGMSLIELHHAVFQQILQGLSLDDLEREVPSFLADFFKANLYRPAVEELEAAKASGHYTAILSSSPDFLVRPAAEFFGVDAWRATEYGVDKDRRLCKIANLMEAASKASFVVETAKRLGIDKDAITAYTDSYHDLLLLNEAGVAVAVNPDRKLKKIAFKHNWRVI